MQYEIVIKPLAEKDIRNIPRNDSIKILQKIILLKNDLQGDVKKLTNFTPEYRLRVGNYRVLFDISDSIINVYRVSHRKDIYK